MLRRRTAISRIAVAFVVLLFAVVARWDFVVMSAAAQTSGCANGVAVPDPADNPGLVSDCEALLTAPDTLAGSETLSWSADTLIEDWKGVTVSGAPLRVTELSLDYDFRRRGDRRLTGTIPSQLGSLSKLEVLDLYGNKLTGPIPSSLGNLSSLRVLNLGANDLSGSIPSSLGSLSNLQVLDLGASGLTGGAIPSWISGLSNLKVLDLYGSQLSGAIPSWLGGLSHLGMLNLGANELTGPIPSELGSLSNLQSLTFYGNGLTGPIPSSFSKLSRLEELILARNQLTGSISSWLGSQSNLYTLDLSSNKLTGPIPSSLGNLSDMVRLYLSANELTGPIPTSLGNLSRLYSLSLSGNELTGPIPTSLGSLSDMEWLSLSGNELTGPIPSELGNLSKIVLLDLSQNRLTGSIPSSLDSLPRLVVLLLSGNLLTGCIPAGLSDMRNNDLNRLGLPLCTTLPLESPTVSSVYPGEASLSITWNAPGNTGASAITAYDLRYAETPSDSTVESDWTVLEDIWTMGAGALSYELTGLTNGTQYDVQVRAINSAGAGPWSETATGTPTEDDLPPRPPANTWYYRDGSNIVVRWDPSALATFYKVYYDDFFDLSCGSDTSDNPSSCDELATNVVGTTYIHTSPHESENYYWVSACNSAGCSDIDGYRPAVFVTSTPGVPGLVSVTAGVASLTIVWSSSEQTDGSTITGYDLRHIETSANEVVESNWTVVEDVWMTGSGALTYELTGLAPGTQYDVQLRATNPAGVGAWSETFTGMPGISADTRAIRSLSPSHVEPGEEVEVTITVDGFGWVGALVETFPDGFSYVSTSLSGSEYVVVGNELRFTLFEISGFTYTVMAPPTEGPYSFSGYMFGLDLVQQEVGGASIVIVQAAPTVEVSYAPGSKALPVRVGSPITVTATFRDPVSGFTADDLVVSNGTVQNLVGSDGDTVYTFDVTPNAIGEVTVDIAADVAEDDDGNGNTAASQLVVGIPYDDDRDGAINRDEVITAITDYLYNDRITRDQVIAMIKLYLFPSG